MEENLAPFARLFFSCVDKTDKIIDKYSENTNAPLEERSAVNFHAKIKLRAKSVDGKYIQVVHFMASIFGPR